MTCGGAASSLRDRHLLEDSTQLAERSLETACSVVLQPGLRIVYRHQVQTHLAIFAIVAAGASALAESMADMVVLPARA